MIDDRTSGSAANSFFDDVVSDALNIGEVEVGELVISCIGSIAISFNGMICSC
jgi:hypothetical protein